jgi:tubulin polyglutamylase TTLL9
MIDDTLKPWLIEVNASPSLTANTKDDYDLKTAMLNDLFDVVDVEGKLSGNEEVNSLFGYNRGPSFFSLQTHLQLQFLECISQFL